MREHIVYWKINDGRRGFLNIEAELYQGEYINEPSYESSIYAHFLRAEQRSLSMKKWPNVCRIISIVETERGRKNKANYRLYNITYTALDGSGDICREVRVVCRTLKEERL